MILISSGFQGLPFPCDIENVVNLVQCFNTEDILCSIEETFTMYIAMFKPAQLKKVVIHKIIIRFKQWMT